VFCFTLSCRRVLIVTMPIAVTVSIHSLGTCGHESYAHMSAMISDGFCLTLRCLLKFICFSGIAPSCLSCLRKGLPATLQGCSVTKGLQNDNLCSRDVPTDGGILHPIQAWHAPITALDGKTSPLGPTDAHSPQQAALPPPPHSSTTALPGTNNPVTPPQQPALPIPHPPRRTRSWLYHGGFPPNLDSQARPVLPYLLLVCVRVT